MFVLAGRVAGGRPAARLMAGWPCGRVAVGGGRVAGWAGAGWPGGRVAGWPGGRVGGWPGGRVAGWPGGRVAGWPGGRLAVWPGGRLAGGRVAGWPGGRVAGWPGGRVAGWPGGRVAGWPGGRVAGWPGGRVAGWPAGRLAAGRLAGWPAGRLAGWPGAGWPGGRVAGWPGGRVAGWPWPGRGRDGRQLKKAIVRSWVAFTVSFAWNGMQLKSDDIPPKNCNGTTPLNPTERQVSCQWLCSYCRSNLSCSSSRCSWPRSRSFWVSNSQIMVKSTFSEFLPTFHYLMMTVLIFIFLISVELVKSGDCWSKKVHEIFNQFLSAWWLLSRAISSHTSSSFFPRCPRGKLEAT